MPSAILVAGDEPRFLDSVAVFRKFLQQWVGIPRNHIHTIRSAYLYREELLRRMWNILQKELSPTLILYCGHGFKTGWSTNSQAVTRISYQTDLAPLVTSADKSIVIINEACYSGALREALIHNNAPEEKVSLIASGGARDITFTYPFLGDIMRCWYNRSAYTASAVQTFRHTLYPEREEDQIYRRRTRTLACLASHQITEGKNWGEAPTPPTTPILVPYEGEMFEMPEAPEEMSGPLRWGVTLDHHFFAK